MTRGRFDGMFRIVRYNWPRYAASGALVMLAAAWILLRPGGPPWMTAAAWTSGVAAAWWTLASLAASHWIYDRSEAYRWTWIPPIFDKAPRRWLNLHAGVDDSSGALTRLFAGSDGTSADFFQDGTVSESSIRRARKEREGRRDERVDPARLPFADGSFDAVFLLFSAHELRRTPDREALFREIRRVLAPAGTAVLAEHARDPVNFAFFGPGAFHFLPAGEWRRLAGVAGLERSVDRRMTPFVRVMTFRSNP